MPTARIVWLRPLRGNLSSLDQPQPRSLCISLLQVQLVHAFARVAYHSTNVLGEFLDHLYKRIIYIFMLRAAPKLDINLADEKLE